VSTGGLRRFLHLERARPPAPAGERAEAPSAAADRFAAVERPRHEAAPNASATGVALARFDEEPAPALELLETAAGARPFTRCMRCGRDHGVFATGCDGCGASLDTDEQRTFNERLWAARQADAAREAEAAAERRALAERAHAEDARLRRAMGEALAREVGRRERRRLDAELPGEGPGHGALASALTALTRRALAALRRSGRSRNRGP
jgi:hypothetical protein